MINFTYKKRYAFSPIPTVVSSPLSDKSNKKQSLECVVSIFMNESISWSILTNINLFSIGLGLILAVLCFGLVASDEFSRSDRTVYNGLDNFKAFIDHFGHDAISFLGCMGPTFVTHCGPKTIACLAARSVPTCLRLLVCEGQDCVKCIHHIEASHKAHH